MLDLINVDEEEEEDIVVAFVVVVVDDDDESRDVTFGSKFDVESCPC